LQRKYEARDGFLESLHKPGREGGSNLGKRPSSDVEPSNYGALETKRARSGGVGIGK
jgi:hypothetical protein